MLFENFLKEIKTVGGLTVNHHLNKITFDSGYIVAEKGVIIDTKELSDINIIAAMKNAIDSIYFDNCKIGFWLDTDGLLYVDIVHHYQTIEYAKFFGLQWSQKAIFDCSNNVEISFPFNF